MAAEHRDQQKAWDLADYETICRSRTTPERFHDLYGAVGDTDWTTHTANVLELRRIQFAPRVLLDVSDRSIATSMLGTEATSPVMIAPTGDLCRVHPEGERAVAEAASEVGAVYVVSASPSWPVRDLIPAGGDRLRWWQQVFLYRDRRITAWQLREAEDLGARAIVWTVSNTGAPTRRRPTAPDASTQARENQPAPYLHGYPHRPVPTAAELGRSWEDRATWSDVGWFRKHTALPLVLKGVQTAEDAKLAVEHGVDALVVSNHGGRMLSDARATIDALPEVVEAVDDKVEVYVDGGFQTGHDVLKALSLGARAVLVGRGFRWGQQVDGRRGILDVLRILNEELDVAMAWAGVSDVRHVPVALISREGSEGRR